MEKKPINPWTWQTPYNFSQAWQVDKHQSIIFVSGQASLSSDGLVLHEGDFKGQVHVTLQNVRTVLNNTGASLDDVVKLGIFLTDMNHFPAFVDILSEYFTGEKPANTVVKISGLALPGLLIEIEAIAVL
jgi:reactive intermediate/imine deaminase